MSTQLFYQRKASGMAASTSGRGPACCSAAAGARAAPTAVAPPLQTRSLAAGAPASPRRQPSGFPSRRSAATTIVAAASTPHRQPRYPRSSIAAAAAAATPGPAAAAAEGAAPRAPSLPPGDFSRIKKATFISSAVDLKGCPPDGRFAEFAVIGRSNVGKSSLINMLTGSDKLARVSKEPGMTKTINHYLINDSWYLVDLPGYGYAKTSQKTAASWLGFTKDYFLQRDALVAVLLLVDASIPPQPLDLECADWLATSEVPFAVVFTKTDARKKGGAAPAQNMAAFKKGLLEEWESLPSCFTTSSREGKGKAEVLSYLASLRRLAAEEGS